MSERAIFIAALEKDDPAEQAAFLDQACADDQPLRQRIERLLKAHKPADSFLEHRPPELGVTVDEPPLTEKPGMVIGPYKLMEQIGDGGMGLVFVAEQQEPVRRKVALKIIKPGMDSKQVIARFEAERQALAMMDHQNIAKVFDAGTTETGRPYFVMELVHGVPITDYCDANKLTPRQRLELFVPVCQAIQHAHQKGIIHRDIKPSNVLVTMYDDKPVPKVIDFGVAKAIEQRLTEKSIYTQFGTLVGTFEYMSPEQAEMNAFGVDTRSDIYALGVLLYELLTGTTPLKRQRLREAAFDEIRRIIKEEEPQRPSVRLSTSGTLAKVAEARKTEPAKLSRLMRGELDWVVMKCLEKDRSRRYDTASNLAREVERYLKDEPVEARPPSAWYRLRKAARRNRTALSMAGVVAAMLVLGTGVILWQAKRANEAMENERRQYALDRAIEAAFSGDLPKKAGTAIVAAEKAGVAPDRVHWLHGLVHYQEDKFDDAIREFELSMALKPSVAAYAMHSRAVFATTLHSGNPFKLHPELTSLELSSMTPETAEDYLCRGYATGFFARDQALSDLDKAIAMRDTPIAHAFRAETVGRIAGAEWDLSLMERALDDIRYAKLRLADHKSVRLTSLRIHLLAADMFEETGQPGRRKTLLEEAGLDAQELKDGHTLDGVMALVYYFEHMGDREAALAELDRASLRPKTSDLLAQYALRLYELGQDTKALDILRDRLKPNNLAGQILQVILWADQVGRDKAYDRYMERVAPRLREANGGKTTAYEMWALLLLGKRKEPENWADMTFHLLPGTTASSSEAELLKSAGKYRNKLCFAYYYIALRLLADGDREGARRHFQKVLDTKSYGAIPYPYARAFLARLERDDKWPKWIEAKK